MSSLASLAEIPQLVIECFKTIKVQKNGCYQICMKIKGEWQIVLLDDYFPCSKKSQQPLFAKPNGEELWVMLLEKAWAKVNGGYLNIVGGTPTEVMSVLTNFGVEYCSHDIKDFNKDNHWKKIKDSDDKGFIMACASRSTGDGKNVGIVQGHAYTLMKAMEATLKSGDVRLLQIRNPWGNFDFTGSWSDGSKEWTKEAKKAFDYEEEAKDDGIFHIEYSDYLTYFNDTEFCHVATPSTSKFIRIKGSNLTKFNFIDLTVLTDNSYISIEGLRKTYRFKRDIPDGAQVPIHVICIEKNNGTLRFVGANTSYDSSPLWHSILNAGQYLIIAFSDYNVSTGFDNKYLSWSVYVTSNNFFNLNVSNYSLNDDDSYLLIADSIANYIKDVDNSTLKDPKMNSLCAYDYKGSGFGMVYLENKTSDTIFQMNMDLNSCRGFQLVFPYSSKTFPIDLPPNSNVVILGKILCTETTRSFGFSYSYGANSYSDDQAEAYDKIARKYDNSIANVVDYGSIDPSSFAWVHKKN